MNNKKFRAKDLAYIALGAALIVACAWIPAIPVTTIEFTMQLLAVFAVVEILGGLRGTLAILVYLLLGTVGVPVFAGFTGGVGILLGATGGYLVGFLFIGLIYWLAEAIFGKKLLVEIIAMLIGLAVCYAFGTAWFMVVYTNNTGSIGLGLALSWCVLPFIPFDLIKLAIGVLVGKRLQKFIAVH